MSGAVLRAGPDPYRIGHHNVGHGASLAHGEGGIAPKRIITGYGFWLFLLSDIVMFSCFFAAYAVLSPETAGGPRPQDIFDIGNVELETAFLLASSFACGIAMLGVEARNQVWTQVALLITGLLGAGFLALEIHEFVGLDAQGAGPQQSAFLTAFFTLVGCHGVHVSCGLLWLGTMMAQFWAKGFPDFMNRRFMCFSLFWHALDIIWVGIFSIVYLFGTAR